MNFTRTALIASLIAAAAGSLGQSPSTSQASITKLKVSFTKEITGRMPGRTGQAKSQAQNGIIANVSGILSAGPAQVVEQTQTGNTGVRVVTEVPAPSMVRFPVAEVHLSGSGWAVEPIAYAAKDKAGECNGFYFIAASGDDIWQAYDSKGGVLRQSPPRGGRPALFMLEGQIDVCLAFAVPEMAKQQELKLTISGREFSIK